MMGGVANADAYGLGSLVTANHKPPRPIGLILPKSPSSSSAAYLWKAQPESVSRLKPNAVPSRSTSEGSATDRSPRSAASFSLPPSAVAERPFGGATPRSRPQTPAADGVSPASLLRVNMNRRSPPRAPTPGAPNSREATAEDLMPPLRRPRDTSPPRTPRDSEAATAPDRPGAEAPPLDVRPIKPNFVRHAPDRLEDDGGAAPAPAELVPRLSRPEYYSSPSVEAMAKMSEAKLSRLDNLEIGRFGYGSVRWPGLTDVRGADFDAAVSIDRGSLTLYPDREKPKVGEGLNKEAVVTLHVRPSRTDAKIKSADMLRARLTKISEDFGGMFLSYDMEKWIFRVPHFDGLHSSG